LHGNFLRFGAVIHLVLIGFAITRAQMYSPRDFWLGRKCTRPRWRPVYGSQLSALPSSKCQEETIRSLLNVRNARLRAGRRCRCRHWRVRRYPHPVDANRIAGGDLLVADLPPAAEASQG